MRLLLLLLLLLMLATMRPVLSPAVVKSRV